MRSNNDYSSVFRNTGTSQRVYRDGNYSTTLPFVRMKRGIRKSLILVLIISILIAAYSLVKG